MNPKVADRPPGNILVVDDNPANQRFLATMLTEQGYKVRSVSNGQMALAAARAAPPDLILLDINMPEMSGYEVCEQLKADVQTHDIPIIFVSALDKIQDKVRAFAAGGVDFVTKPFRGKEVLARVETHLALRDLQQQLQETNAELALRLGELQERNEELDAFAHTVAHDLKNPLTSLIGYSSMLDSRYADLPEEQLLRSVRSIGANARRMDNIIEELLLLAGVRKLAGVQMKPLDMGEIVTEALARLADLSARYQADFQVPDEWPVALGRGQWVEEVWTNYLSNAIKYGGQPPRIELGFTILDLEAPQNAQPQIKFWVRDNGQGLTPDEQARLFTPFEQLHQVRAEGHGLGLSLVKRIVDKLGGEVGVESETGQGSLFYFTLPAGAD